MIRAWPILVALIVTIAPAAATGTTMDYGRLGTVALYEPAGTPTELVFFVSGDGGLDFSTVSNRLLG